MVSTSFYYQFSGWVGHDGVRKLVKLSVLFVLWDIERSVTGIRGEERGDRSRRFGD
jgi:hypothetical protein